MHHKNIVFVINEYNGHGGAQRVAAIMADEFYKDGHNVSVLSINKQKESFSYFSDHIKVKILHSRYRAPLPIEISSNLKSLKFKKVFLELKRRYLLERKRKEIYRYFDSSFGKEEVFVIVIQVYGMQWIEDLMFNKNINIIGQSHESVDASKNSHRYNRILRYYRQIPKFLLLTKKDSNYFEGKGFGNTGVMHNPTPFREFNAPEKLYANKVVISSGRLIKEKGFDVLIESFARIANEIPEWKLHIYGEGPVKKSLQNLINSLQMTERIILKGQTDNIQAALKLSSFFVLPSQAEGLPMTLIEAQSCGLPCISTDCAPGIREIINEYSDGLIAPVDDVIILSRHIRRLALDSDLFAKYSQNAFLHSKNFDRNTIKNKWYSLFGELGGKR